MLKKKIFYCTVSFIFIQYGSAFSQRLHGPNDHRPLAYNNEENVKSGIDAVILSPGSKVVHDSMVISNPPPSVNKNGVAGKPKNTVKNQTLDIPPIAPNVDNTKLPIITAYEGTEKYKPVPLAGELEYYGNMNSYVLDYVKSYMNNHGSKLTRASTKTATLETIDKVLDAHDIPKELKYLAVIESALNKTARSPVGAYGYWQFMAPTAKYMGLTVNGRRDDRTDLTKSTHAAAKYLSYLYDQMQDWLLVVAAYNSGPRPVVNAIKRTGKTDFWSIKKYLPKETQNHVLAFIATATIMERLNHFLAPGLPSDFDWACLNINRTVNAKAEAERKAAHPLLSKFSEEEIKKMAIVRIKTPIDLEVVCHTLKIDRRQLGRWNYDYFDYLDTYQNGKIYNFRIPKDKLDEFIEKKGQIEKISSTSMKMY